MSDVLNMALIEALLSDLDEDGNPTPTAIERAKRIPELLKQEEGVKDLSAMTTTGGGALIAPARQGKPIKLKRPKISKKGLAWFGAKACVPTSTGNGFYEDTTGHPCSPNQSEQGPQRRSAKIDLPGRDYDPKEDGEDFGQDSVEGDPNAQMQRIAQQQARAAQVLEEEPLNKEQQSSSTNQRKGKPVNLKSCQLKRGLKGPTESGCNAPSNA